MKKLDSSLGWLGHKLALINVTGILLGFSFLHAEMDTVYVHGVDKLNTTIESLIENETLSRTVVCLENNSQYFLNNTITVPAGEKLTLVATETGQTQDESPPQILWESYHNISEKEFLITVNGNLEMKNIWVLFASSEGYQMGTPITFNSDTTGASDNIAQHGSFENCIFDYMPCPVSTSSGVICIQTKHFNGNFQNCYFRNCIDPHLKYYGRAVSFPYDSSGFHTDSISFENCTFANIGYVYQQENGNYADYVSFNHCTFLNVVMHSLQSGWWNKAAVSNSLWVNGYMSGETPSQTTYQGDFNGGTMRIDSISTFGFEVPFSEQERRILFAHNSYYVEDWLVNWMANSETAQEFRESGNEEYIPVPQPMLSPKTLAFFESDSFPYMNTKNLYDSINPGFSLAPTDTGKIKWWLDTRWYGSLDTNWAWHPEYSIDYIWPLQENLAYTNDTILTAAMGNFPLGDLYHWFPERYLEWESQKNDEHNRIMNWLETGKDSMITAIDERPEKLISDFQLYQNYPNPFNPTTQIKYTINQNARVNIKVYNMLGQEVMTLQDKEQTAGEYCMVFNGKDLASGIYFYQMKVENRVNTKKMLLLK